MLIPVDRQQDVIDVFWVLLTSLESDTDPKKDVFDRLTVEAGYRIMNDLNVTTEGPRWKPRC